MKPETEIWVSKSDEHRRVAEVLLREGHFPQCIFFCEQAIETLLKAIWVEGADEGSPPRVHDLVALGKSLQLQLSSEQLEFLRLLQEQYMPTRYGDIPVEYSRETAENYMHGTRGIYTWLLQKLN